MKAGAPFRCTNCNAQLTWQDHPVIECEYCHTKILMGNVARPAAPTARKGPNVALIILGAAVVAGVVVIAVRASGSKNAAKPAPAPVAATPPPTSTPATVPVDSSPFPPAIAKVTLTFGAAGTNAGQLTDAAAIAVTPAGEIVVAEARSGRVQVFDATGTYQKLITLPPSKLTHELTVFGAGTTPDGKVVVSRAGDLLVLDVAAGIVSRTIAGNYPDVFYHGDVEVVPDGSIYAVTDRTGDLNLVHLSAAGKIVGQQKSIGVDSVAIDGLGTQYLTKRFDAAVEVRSAKGEVLRKFSQTSDGTLSSPSAIAIDGKGHVFVADSSSLVVFDPEGKHPGTLAVGPIQDLAVDRAGAVWVLGRDKVTRYELTL